MSFTKTISTVAALASIFGAGAAGWKLAEANSNAPPAVLDEKINQLDKKLNELSKPAPAPAPAPMPVPQVAPPSVVMAPAPVALPTSQPTQPPPVPEETQP